MATLIEGYWRLHPHMADGVDGVIWWLPQCALEPRALVYDALERLVARGVAVKKRREDGTVTYSLTVGGLPGA